MVKWFFASSSFTSIHLTLCCPNRRLNWHDCINFHLGGNLKKAESKTMMNNGISGSIQLISRDMLLWVNHTEWKDIKDTTNTQITKLESFLTNQDWIWMAVESKKKRNTSCQVLNFVQLLLSTLPNFEEPKNASCFLIFNGLRKSRLAAWAGGGTSL